MKLATCVVDGRARAALAVGGRLELLSERLGSVVDIIAAGHGAAVVRAGVETELPIAEADMLPPVPAPEKIICVGLNYADHVSETGTDRPAHPSLFVRFANSFVGHGKCVVAPSNSTMFDYEGELAVIIGRPAWRVRAADALGHVGGYSCLAENSVRDFQRHTQQATAGKNFLSSGSWGPWISTLDEVGDLAALQLSTRLNGELVQKESLSALMFPVPEIIEYISSFTRLVPGDVIATGTPAGVGARRQPPLWMKPGDVLEVDISRIGTLRNGVAAEAPGA